MLNPDIDASVDFLQWRGEPWVLTAITPDKKRIETRTLSDVESVRVWLDKYSGERNIYYVINPCEPIQKKPNELDITEMKWIHVDVDPREGEDFREERERILTMLSSPPQDIPTPTAIVDSGGGYQAFWRLREPVAIVGGIAQVEQLKLYNKQLEIVLGGDHCHSLEHLMRLPGTINLPDKNKLAKGRIKYLAKVVLQTDTLYDLKNFKAAPRKDETSSQPGLIPATPRIQSLKAMRIKSTDELDKYSVPDWCKVVIVQGHDPDNPKKNPSRSEWLWSVVCELVRCKVPDELVYGIITDPTLHIADSVLDKRNPEKYALRQIDNAKENAEDPVLRELNEKHAVISDVGGKCRVISEVWDHALGRPKLSRQTFDDFRNRYLNRYVKTEAMEKPMPAGKWWLIHKNRRQYDTIVFAPGREVEGAYNLWRGFAVDPEPGKCDMFLGHLQENICQNNEQYYNYLIRWMAMCVQKPDSPGYVAVVMRGKRGTGKSYFAKTFGSLFGRHFMQVSDPKHLVGSFNAHLRDCVVLFGDEAFYANDKKHESVLKTLITEELMTVEYKGMDVEMSPNFTHIILASNDQWVVPSGADERRFFVLDVGEKRKGDIPYFFEVEKEMGSGGRAALLHYLMQFDITKFDVRSAPLTKALHDQKLYSLSPMEAWWLNKLEDGKLLPEHTEWLKIVDKDTLLHDWLEAAKDQGVQRRGNAISLGKFLIRVCPDDFPKRTQGRRRVRRSDSKTEEITRPYQYEFPSLEICRRTFVDVCLGGDHQWDEQG